jgi:hypothetical protein
MRGLAPPKSLVPAARVDVRFTLKASQLVRCSEVTRWARGDISQPAIRQLVSKRGKDRGRIVVFVQQLSEKCVSKTF